MALVIVESPSKGPKIRAILGAGFDVEASYGHISDLPLRELGVEPPTFRPKYEVTDKGKSRLSRLRELVKKHNGDVYLATDLDREGEAISYHLATLLKLSNPKRITFSEITQSAITKAIRNPRGIDMALVAGQECRRVLDRFVGYLPTPTISAKFGGGNSAGRVQSIGLRVVYERHKARAEFQAVEHYNVIALFEKDGIEFSAEWVHPFKKFEKAEDDEADHVDGNKSKYLQNKPAAEKMAAAVNNAPYFTVAKYETKEVSQSPPCPFTTSLLQQAAGKKFGWSSKDTMKYAQELYEAGLITYHRTDSKHLSDESIAQIREFLQAFQTANGLSGYLPAQPNKFASGQSAQEAHEAIRPSDVNDTGASIVSKEAQDLYSLIRTRTIASQLAPARFLATAISLQHDATSQEFVLRGRQLKFEGWKKFTVDDVASESKDDGADAKLPRLSDGERLESKQSEVRTSVTKPPGLLTEPELIKILERKGIGRPSTYASICATNIERGYIEKDKKGALHITQPGISLVVWLIKNFTFLAFEYSAHMETGIDEVIAKKKSYIDFVSDVYNTVTREVRAVNMGDPSINTDSEGNIVRQDYPVTACPTCKKLSLTRYPSKKKPGKFFWGCKERCGQDMMGDSEGVPVAMSPKKA